jgi:prepilin-type N-terminal cleavage/methylation domain-containing protein
MIHTHNRQSGFTLIELLVVISIIALLSSIILASFSNARASSRDAIRYSDINQINKAIQLYISATGHAPDLQGTCPASGAGSNTCTPVSDAGNPSGIPSLWTLFTADIKPYMSKAPIDPCGQNCPGAAGTTGYFYNYVPPAQMAAYCAANPTTCQGQVLQTSYQVYAQNLEKKSVTTGVASFGPFGVPVSSGTTGGGGGSTGY